MKNSWFVHRFICSLIGDKLLPVLLDPLLQHAARVEAGGVPGGPVVMGRGPLLQPHEVVHVLVANLMTTIIIIILALGEQG